MSLVLFRIRFRFTPVLRPLVLGAGFLVSSVFALPSHAASHQIIIENMKFTPDSLEVKSGDTVEWVNKDLVPHTASSQSPSAARFDSKQIDGGKSWRHRFAKPGDYSYVCLYHPTMKARLKVTGSGVRTRR